MHALALPFVVFLAAGSPATERPARFALDAATVNGRTVLGKRLYSVTAAFGRADAVERFRYATYLRYGSRRDFRLRVEFRRRAGRLVATSFELRQRALVEARLGRALALRPSSLQDAITSAYEAEFALSSEYQSLKGECVGGFAARRGGVRVTFGLASHRTFIRISRR